MADKKNIVKILVFILILAFYGSLLVYKIELPAYDDMARHIKNGELVLQGNFDVLYKNVYSYTEPDHPFINHHWLSGVVFYLLHQVVGWSGLVVFKVIVLLSAFTLIFLTALRKADFWLVALLSPLAILVLIERSTLRPEIFSYLFIAIFLYLLIDLEKHPERKRIFLLIPLQLLWVNMHVFWSIGIMLALGFLFEKIVLNYKDLKNNPLVRKLAFLLVVLVLISFVNPNGIQGVLYHYPRDFPLGISENLSLSQFKRTLAPGDDITILLITPLVFLMALSFVFSFLRRQKPIFYFLAGTATALLSFVILRGVAFFGLLFLPVVSANFNEAFIRAKEFLVVKAGTMKNNAGNILTSALIIVLFFLIFLGSQKKILPFTKTGIGLSPRSNDAALFFKEQHLRGPIFNDPDVGSYLIYHLYPQEKVFVDNRFGDAYSASFFATTYGPMLTDENRWQEELARHNFNAIFFYLYDNGPENREFLYERIRDPAWAFVYADTYAVIFLRNTPENQDVIATFRITRENAAERLKHLAESPRFDDQVAAADIFNLVGREDLSAELFLKVVATWPEKAKIWMIMGEWELRKDDSPNSVLAMMYLEKAIMLGYTTAEAYSYLSMAYFKMGQYQKAEKALLTAQAINPEWGDFNEWLQVVRSRQR